MDKLLELPDDKCAICGKFKVQHTTNSGYGMCQIYPVFVSERTMFDRLSRTIQGSSTE